MNETKSKRLDLHVEPSVYERLREAKHRERVTMGELIRRAIIAELDRIEAK